MDFDCIDKLNNGVDEKEPDLIVMNARGFKKYHSFILPPNVYIKPDKTLLYNGVPVVCDEYQEEMVRFVKYVD